MSTILPGLHVTHVLNASYITELLLVGGDLDPDDDRALAQILELQAHGVRHVFDARVEWSDRVAWRRSPRWSGRARPTAPADAHVQMRACHVGHLEQVLERIHDELDVDQTESGLGSQADRPVPLLTPAAGSRANRLVG